VLVLLSSQIGWLKLIGTSSVLGTWFIDSNFGIQLLPSGKGTGQNYFLGMVPSLNSGIPIPLLA